MTDSLGNELKVGDKVVFVNTDYSDKFRSFDTGVVEKLCDSMVWIKDTKKKYINRGKMKETKWGMCYETLRLNRTLRKYNRIIKL